MFTNYRKLLALAILVAVCGWLVRRNLLAPGPTPNVSSRQGSLVDAALSNRQPGEQKATLRAGGSLSRPAAESVADLDPTLRLDLLEAARAVKYQGSSRNIFQTYAPPPPPPPVRPATPPSSTASTAETPAALMPPAFAFKFYGTAQPTGTSSKRAFLTNGEEIVIAKEGEMFGKFYRVNRIGPSSLEIEDIRSKQLHQLPLVEDIAGAETGLTGGAGAASGPAPGPRPGAGTGVGTPPGARVGPAAQPEDEP